jgi:hypothetical protein
MVDRVACAECGAHRDRSLPNTQRCFVCESPRVSPVLPNIADIDQAILTARSRLAFLEGTRLQLQRLHGFSTQAEASH